MPIEEGRRVRLKKDYETEFWPKVKLSQGDTGLVESGQLSRTVGVRYRYNVDIGGTVYRGIPDTVIEEVGQT